MKITGIETIPVQLPINPQRAIRSGRGYHTSSPFLIVKVQTDEGVVGLGEVSCTAAWSGEDQFTAARIISTYLAPLLIGQDPTHIERLTLDVDLSFWTEMRSVTLPGVAVAEVKQDRIDRGSGFMQQMHSLGIQPTGFSKYCIGVALLFPQIKHNNFKPKLRLLQHLIER